MLITKRQNAFSSKWKLLALIPYKSIVPVLAKVDALSLTICEDIRFEFPFEEIRDEWFESIQNLAKGKGK